MMEAFAAEGQTPFGRPDAQPLPAEGDRVLRAVRS